MGILDLLQRGSQQMGGLLFPGMDATGVDPRVAQAARAQAMMQLGSGILGGQDYGRAYGAAQQSGYEPIEQARREAVMRAAAEDRQAQAQERQRQMQEREAQAARNAQIQQALRSVPLDPSNPQAYAGGLASAAAPYDASLALEALKTQQGFAPKQQDLPEGMMWSNGQPVQIPGYVQMRSQIAAAGRAPSAGPEMPKPPPGYRFTVNGLEPIPGGPADPNIPQRTALTPKDASAARNKLNQISAARQQLALAKEKLSGLQGTLSQGIGGKYLPTESGKAFDAAIDSMRGSITAITRVPGVGAMSDFETRLDQAKFPDRNEYEAVAAQKLKSLEDLLNGLDQGYQGMLGFENPAAQQQPAMQAPSRPSLKSAPAAAVEYLRQHPEAAPAFKEKYGYLP
jgi:hypothetical protein